jgi:hypothetical protein
VLLKGPVLAKWLYEEPSARLYADADLLIDPDRFDAARAVVQELGYTGGEIEVSRHLPRNYAETWEGEASVELHRTISGIGAPVELVWSELAANTDRLDVEGIDVETLSEAGRCLTVALHAAHHGAEAERPLDDLRRAVERVPLEVWREGAALADRLDASAAFAAGLRLAEHGPALLEAIGATPDRRVETELRAASEPHMAVMLAWLLHGKAPARHKLMVVARKVVPPVDWMEATSPLARRGPMGLAAAYAVRPVTLVRRLPAALRALRRAQRKL